MFRWKFLVYKRNQTAACVYILILKLGSINLTVNICTLHTVQHSEPECSEHKFRNINKFEKQVVIKRRINEKYFSQNEQ